MRSEIKELQGVFGPKVEMTTTGQVLTMPSNIGTAKAVKAIQDMPFDGCMAAIAAVCAREVGGELVGAQVRPADYSQVQDVLSTVMARVIDELQERPQYFAKELADRLKEQG